MLCKAKIKIKNMIFLKLLSVVLSSFLFSIKTLIKLSFSATIDSKAFTRSFKTSSAEEDILLLIAATDLLPFATAF